MCPLQTLLVIMHSHTRWDGMGWASLVTECVNVSTELPAQPITPRRRVCVCECIITDPTLLSSYGRHLTAHVESIFRIG